MMYLFVDKRLAWRARNETLKSDSEQKQNYVGKINLLYMEKQTTSTIVPGNITPLSSPIGENG